MAMQVVVLIVEVPLIAGGAQPDCVGIGTAAGAWAAVVAATATVTRTGTGTLHACLLHPYGLCASLAPNFFFSA